MQTSTKKVIKYSLLAFVSLPIISAIIGGIYGAQDNSPAIINQSLPKPNLEEIAKNIENEKSTKAKEQEQRRKERLQLTQKEDEKQTIAKTNEQKKGKQDLGLSIAIAIDRHVKPNMKNPESLKVINAYTNPKQKSGCLVYSGMNSFGSNKRSRLITKYIDNTSKFATLEEEGATDFDKYWNRDCTGNNLENQTDEIKAMFN